MIRMVLAALLATWAVELGRWHFERNGIDQGQVYARTGWLSPKLAISNRTRLQSVEIRQGPLGRRGGYATLHLGLAGGTMAIDALPAGEAQRIRDAVLESVAGLDFSQVS